jgi:hypothetical protein
VLDESLNEMAEWLKSCRIDTVAVQATGVYWIALYDVLDSMASGWCFRSPRYRRAVSRELPRRLSRRS